MADSCATKNIANFVNPSEDEDDDYDHSKIYKPVLEKYGFNYDNFVYDQVELGWGFDIKGFYLACKKINEIVPGTFIFEKNRIKLSSLRYA